MSFHLHHHHSKEEMAGILSDTSGGAAAARRVIIIGSVINLCLSALKLITGYLGNSEALVADGIHSLGDFATDAIIFLFIGISFRSPDKNFSYGYGKFETIATLAVSLLIGSLGIAMVAESSERIAEFLRGETIPRPDIWTVVVICVAIIAKECLYRYYTYSGKRLGLMALKALGFHHRIDAFASVATLIGVTCAHFFGDSLAILDPAASLLISVFIIVSAINLLLPSLGQLVERSVPEKLESEIRETLLSNGAYAESNNAADESIKSEEESIKSEENSIKINRELTGDDRELAYLRTRSNGRRIIIDAGLKVNPSTTVAVENEIRESISERLSSILPSPFILTLAFYPK